MKTTACLVRITTACLGVERGQKTNPLTSAKTITLPDVQGSLNHMSVDASRQRLFAPAPSDKRLEIVDLRAGEPWRSRTSERPAAARYPSELDRPYVSSGRYLYVYAGSDFALLTRTDLQSRLDELVYNAQSWRLCAGCMTDGKTGIAVIAVPEGKLLERISLPASPQGNGCRRCGEAHFRESSGRQRYRSREPRREQDYGTMGS